MRSVARITSWVAVKEAKLDASAVSVGAHVRVQTRKECFSVGTWRLPAALHRWQARRKRPSSADPSAAAP